MKVFLASSQESLEDLREISSWIEQEGHEALPWDNPSLFLPGENTFEKLIQISKQIDAAVFIFAADDKLWYRADALMQPRDNVLIEFGIFAASLGQRRAIICTKGTPKIASDLRGIIIIDKNKPHHARLRLQMWLRNLERRREEDPNIAVLKREVEETKAQLEFERQKSREFEIILTKKGIINFSDYDLSKDGHWKLLYDYDYFWSVVSIIKSVFSTPRLWMDALERCGLTSVTRKISWEHLDVESRTKVMIAKSLRVIRRFETWQSYDRLLDSFDVPLRDSIVSIGKVRAQTLSTSVIYGET